MTLSDVRIVMMAGGTGGHVFPALAVARYLRDLGVEVTWIGTAAGIEARLVPDAGFAHEWIPVSGLRGKGRLTLLLAPVRLLKAVAAAFAVLRRVRPQAVVGMGGFASGPGGLAAKLLGMPLMIHEQNAAAGMTNRVLARIANRVLQAFPNTFSEQMEPKTVGNPVRAEFLSVGDPASRLQRDDGNFRMLVVGGSQGAKALNELVPEALSLMPEEQRPEVLHQGGRTVGIAKDQYARFGVAADVREFIDDVAKAMADADLVVCRSGASTIAELTAVGVGSLLVPFPFAVDDHQTANGQHLVSIGAARMIQERNLTPEVLAGELSKLFADRNELRAMAVKAKALSPQSATEVIANECLEMMGAAA